MKKKEKKGEDSNSRLKRKRGEDFSSHRKAKNEEEDLGFALKKE